MRRVTFFVTLFVQGFESNVFENDSELSSVYLSGFEFEKFARKKLCKNIKKNMNFIAPAIKRFNINKTK